MSLATTTGAGGSANYVFDVTNRGSGSCGIGGFFGVELYAPDSALLTATDHRVASFLHGVTAHRVSLQSGATASFAIAFSESGTTTARCHAIGAFHLYPPDNAHYDKVTIADPRDVYCSAPGGDQGVRVAPVEDTSAAHYR